MVCSNLWILVDKTLLFLIACAKEPLNWQTLIQLILNLISNTKACVSGVFPLCFFFWHFCICISPGLKFESLYMFNITLSFWKYFFFVYVYLLYLKLERNRVFSWIFLSSAWTLLAEVIFVYAFIYIWRLIMQKQANAFHLQVARLFIFFTQFSSWLISISVFFVLTQLIVRKRIKLPLKCRLLFRSFVVTNSEIVCL